MAHARPLMAELAVFASIVAAWLCLVFLLTDGEPIINYDTFRDAAYAENIRAGRVLSDPAINGYPFWYAPASPLFFAALAYLFDCSAVDVYAGSVYWLNPCLLLLTYISARLLWGFHAGLMAIPLFWVGSYWWLTLATSPMPSVHGVILNLLGLMLWTHSTTTTRPAPQWRFVLTGLLLGLAIWHHPLSAVILASAIFTHTCFCVCAGGHNRLQAFQPMLVVATVSALLSFPLIIHLVTLPKNNLEPFLFVPAWMLDARFALFAHSPLTLILGILGAALLIKTDSRAWPLLAYLAVCVVGQVLGYLGHFLHMPVPYLLPHEFQYHGQLVLALCASYAAVTVAQLVHRHAFQNTRFRTILPILAILTGLIVLPAIPWVRQPGPRMFFRYPGKIAAAHTELVTWLRLNTSITDTILCEPEVGYFIVCGIAGRKTVACPPGLMNPAVDAKARLEAVRAVLDRDTDAPALKIAHEYQVAYILLTSRELSLHRWTNFAPFEHAFTASNGSSVLLRVPSFNSVRANTTSHIAERSSLP